MAQPVKSVEQAEATSRDLRHIPLDQIRENPVSLRTVKRDSVEYQALLASVSDPKYGVLNAIQVRPSVDSDGVQFYQIIDGLHRYSAAKDAGLQTIPVQVFTDISDDQVYFQQIVGNATKVETRRIDYAQQLKRILNLNDKLTVVDLARALGRPPQWVSENLSLLEITNVGIREVINNGKMSAMNAYQLAKLPPDEQVEFMQAALSEPGSVFSTMVTNRVREIRDARSKGKKAGETELVIRPKLQKITSIEAEIKEPKHISSLLSKLKIKTPLEAAQLALSWVIQQDPDSVTQYKLEFEQKKQLRKEIAEARKSEKQKKIDEEAKQLASQV